MAVAYLWQRSRQRRPAEGRDCDGRAGLRIDEHIDLGSEWGEWVEEHGAQGTRRLLHAARLLRARDRYVDGFGRAAYDIMLADCLWHVYRMLGKLSGHAYLLSKRP